MLKPTAACTLVIHESGLVLAVSRRNDPHAFGLPGGKVDPGEAPQEAAVRELLEETGLKGVRTFSLFTGVCRGGENGVDYLTRTYLCLAHGRIGTRESGRVLWVDRRVLCTPPAPFAEYNDSVFEHLSHLAGQIEVDRFISTIPLDPAHVMGIAPESSA